MKFLYNKLWKRSKFHTLARFLTRYDLVFVVLALLVTVLGTYKAMHLSIDADYMAFLPENTPGVVNLKKVIQKTGGFGNFMLVLEGSTPEKRREFAKAYADAAGQLPWVDYVEYEKGYDKIEKSKFLFLGIDDIREIHDRISREILFKKNPLTVMFLGKEEGAWLDFSDIEKKYRNTSFGSDYFEDPAQKYTIVVIWPKGSMTQMDFAVKGYGDLSALIERLSPKKYASDMAASIGGEFRNKIDEYNSLKQDFAGSIIFVLILICALVYLCYRTKRDIFFVVIPLLMATIWSLGLANVFVGRLNLLTVFIAAILFGIGVDYGIYLFSRYSEERVLGRSMEEALVSAWHDTGRATFSSALTTGLSFLVLIFMPLKGYREFGILALTGILTVFVVFFIFGPSFWILAERTGLVSVVKMKRPTILVPKVPLSKWIVFFWFLATFFGMVVMPFVGFEHDYGKLRSQKNSYWQLSSKIHEVFPLSKTPAVVLTDTQEEAVAVEKAVRKMIPEVNTIDAVKSIVDFLPEKIAEKRKLLASIRQLIIDNSEYMSVEDKKKADQYLPYLDAPFVSMADIPKGVLRFYEGIPGSDGTMVFIFDKVRLSDINLATRYASDIREIKANGKTYYPAEGSMIFVDTLAVMKKQTWIAFWIMLVGVYFILIWDFGSIKQAWTVFFPLGMSLFVAMGVLYLLDVKINIFNMAMFPILVGIGVDNTIHLYHRYLEEKRNHSDAIGRMVKSTGNALLFANLTNLIGFGSMLFGDHGGLRSIGMVAVVGIVCQLLVSLLFFPAYLSWRSR